MNLQDIEDLINNFENSTVREMKLDFQELHLYLNKNTNTSLKSEEAENASSPKTFTVQPEKTIQLSQEEKVDSMKLEETESIKSPLVGTIYLQPKPGQASFVSVGDHVKKGDTVCIVEAMKMMTEVKSKVAGTIVEVCVENEDLVECEQPLFLVKED